MTSSHDRKVCLRLAERVSEYLDDELPPEVRDEVREHFEDCANCEAFLSSLKRIKNLGALLPRELLLPEELRNLAEIARRKLDS